MKTIRIIASAVIALGVCFNSAAQVPEGHLVIIGGGGTTPAIKQAIVNYSGGAAGKLICVGTAGDKPEEAAEKAAASFLKAGIGEAVGICPTREECNNPKYVKKLLKDAGGVFFSGGKQRRITDTIGGTLLHQKLIEFYMKGGLISGSSAGAAIMSDPMLSGKSLKKDKDGKDKKFNSIAEGTVELIPGLGFLKGAIVDQHFIKRQRENRLFSVILGRPDMVAIGIDETTSIVVSKGNEIEVVGKNSVMIIEPDASSVRTDKRGNYAARMNVMLLLEGDKYVIPTK